MSIAWGEKIDLPSGGNVLVGGIRHLLIPPHPPTTTFPSDSSPGIKFEGQKKCRDWRRKSSLNNVFRPISLHGYPQILLKRQTLFRAPNPTGGAMGLQYGSMVKRIFLTVYLIPSFLSLYLLFGTILVFFEG
jgi:hypothetical protein